MKPLLVVKDLFAGYGKSEVVQGVSFSLADGDAVSIFGRNGVGKSTLVNSLMGFVSPDSGTVSLNGLEIARRPIHEIARAGCSIIPQGRRVFPTLTVQENLTLGAGVIDGKWTLERVYELLPRLAERRKQLAGLMSGGEKQMVAIGRALLRNPDLLLLDEPSEGLAPRIIDELAETFREMRAQGMSMILVEQNIALGLSFADRIIVMDMGKFVYEGSADDFRHNKEIATKYLGIA